MVMVTMPQGADERVSPQGILVIREAMKSEKRENPDIKTTIWTGGTRIYPAESINDLEKKFSNLIKVAKLRAPNNMLLLVSMERVSDVDDSGPAYPISARSLLLFGTGAPAPRQAVRESEAELKAIWIAAGVPLDAF